VLLGRIVEIASGMPWEAYVRANIFRPAGMNESAFTDDEGTMADVATGYSTLKGSLTRAGTMNGWGGAAGEIVSTAGDLAKWDAALIGGKLLSADDLSTMLRPGTLPATGPKSHYGYGWVVDAYEGQSRVWHNGGTLGFHATNQIYRGLSETIVVLANKRYSDTDAVANAVFNALHPALAAAASAAAAKPVAGEDPKVTARVKRVWDALLSGTLDRSELSDRVNAELTPAVVARTSKQLKAMGAPPAWTYTGSTATSTMRSYHYRVEFSTGTTLRVTMSVGAGGKITDFAIDPDN
jgi:CubicO group peptidase (beta-lactamase class C family)